MDLTNRTRFPAALYRGCIDEDRLFGSLAVRVTYDLAGGRLVPSEEQSWKVSAGPWEGPHGPMAGDNLFRRGGVDLFVFGSARPPGGPAPRADVTVEVGEHFRHTVAVFGDRVWEKRQGRLVPSEPRPFEAIPLTLANAYGGQDEWDELPVPFPMNPNGKGFALEESSAAGKPLPNVEDPDRLVRNWNDHPEPVGVGAPPDGFGPRVLRGVTFDEDTGRLKELKPRFYNAAFPGMVAPRAAAGDRVCVTGVTGNGPLEFALPPAGLKVRLRFGDEWVEREPAVDQVGVEADARRVFVSYRYPFRYRLVPLQWRACELAEGGA
jgi:hypothetical protein